MKKLTIGLIMIFIAYAFLSCSDDDEIVYVKEVKPLPKPPKDDVNVENIIVTFKNGWEGVADLKDDTFTDYEFYKPVSPSELHPVVKVEEKAAYDTALAEYQRIKAIWEEYNTELAKYEEERKKDPENPKPPPATPSEPMLNEPIFPIAKLPYFPGDEYIDDKDEIQIAGNQPEWDYHTFLGWELEVVSGEDNEITLDTPINKNITIVAKWADTPSRPFKTVTFNRNAGAGIFEKRFAVPSNVLYETESETNMTRTGKSENVIYVTTDKSIRKEGGEIFYEDYIIKGENIDGSKIEQNDPLIPVFTREHYNVKSDAPWADLDGENSMSESEVLSCKFDSDKNLYQQWNAKTFTINFIGNSDINDETIASFPVNEPLSAIGGVSADGKILPVYSSPLVKKDGITYVFKNWADAEQGGNIIGNSTPVAPKEGNDTVTLYAQWGIQGVQAYAYSYTGKSQEWTAPLDGVYKIAAWGAGGNGSGYGGFISGDVKLSKGDKLYIYCGGQGEKGFMPGMNKAGGWNGGGKSGGYGNSYSGSGGSGATDVRTVRAAGADTAWNDAASIASRIIVAGGGGGDAGQNASFGSGGIGIAAGGDGKDGQSYFLASGGGLKAIEGQTAGKGGDAPNDNYRGGGGGGGGYYGGTGGSAARGNSPSGGGGGSSWVKLDGNGIKFIEHSIAPEPLKGGGNNNGPGRVTITYLNSD
ncbi:MAG: hypothetical protein LBC27_08865 [Spirochaetaceae bacterium]|jgi:hypothetical protein|nr:hypothetical protein [Spirochaetaceae bacterium]